MFTVNVSKCRFPERGTLNCKKSNLVRRRRVVGRRRHGRLRNVAERRVGGRVVQRRARRGEAVAAARRQPVERQVVVAIRRGAGHGRILHAQDLDPLLNLSQLEQVVL